MELLIKIPKEFEQHFKQDAFEDSLHRLSVDAHLIAGLYEQETAKMLRDAFKNAIPIPEHGRLIDADEMKGSIRTQTAFLRLIGGELAEIAETLEKGFLQEIDNAPTIIPEELMKEKT